MGHLYYSPKRHLSGRLKAMKSTANPMLASARRWIAGFALSTICCGLQAQSSGAPGNAASIEAALRQGQNDAALTMARDALKRHPGDSRILTLEGIAYSSLGRQHEALAAFQDALKFEPNSLAALEGAAQLEFDSGDPGAERLLHRIVALRPVEPTSHAMLAVIAYKHNDCVGAIEQFSKATEVIAQEPAALTEYGACLLDADRASDAAAELRKACAIRPDDTRLRYNLAVAQQAAHLDRDALATLQPLLDAANPDPDSLDLAAEAHEDLEETPEAVRLLRMALIAEPKELKYYMDFAALALKHSSWQVGLDIVNLGLKELPDVAPLYVARGVFEVQQDDFPTARKDFEIANHLDPNNTGATIAQGMSEIQQHDPKTALETIDAELRAHPDDAFLEYLKALALTKNGAGPGSREFAQALEAARKSVETKDAFVVARDLLAEMDLEAGDLAGAEKQSRLALEQNPTDEKAMYHLIQALKKSGKDSYGELPELAKRLDAQLAAKRTTETTENKYRLYEPQAASQTESGQGK
jgi:Flp pilus assembly protein TadD